MTVAEKSQKIILYPRVSGVLLQWNVQPLKEEWYMYLLYLSVPAMLVVMLCHCAQLALRYRLDGSICPIYSPNVSTTPITAMGCRQCLPLSVVQLKGKHCRKLHCRNGVVDTFGLSPPWTFHILKGKLSYFGIRFLNHIFFCH